MASFAPTPEVKRPPTHQGLARRKALFLLTIAPRDALENRSWRLRIRHCAHPLTCPQYSHAARKPLCMTMLAGPPDLTRRDDADISQRERSRSPRRGRSRSPGRAGRRRSYSRSRSPSRDDYRRSSRRSRSPMTGTGATPGGSVQGFGAPQRSFEDRQVAREQMMSSIRDQSQQDRRVYVGNLSYDVKWHHLKDFMRQGMARPRGTSTRQHINPHSSWRGSLCRCLNSSEWNVEGGRLHVIHGRFFFFPVPSLLASCWN